MKKLKVKDYMSKELIKISEDATVHDAVEKMLENNIHGLLVTNGVNRPKGIVSVDDLLILIEKGEGETDMLVKEFMSRVIFSIDVSEDLMKALEIMTKNKTRHLPVTEDDKVVGMITSSDILRAFKHVYGKR